MPPGPDRRTGGAVRRSGRVERIAGQLDQCEPLGQHPGVSPHQRPLPGMPVTVQHRHRRRLCRHRAGGAGAGGRPCPHPGRLRRRPARPYRARDLIVVEGGAQRRRLAGLPAPEYPPAPTSACKPPCSPISAPATSLTGTGWCAPHDSFYRDDEQEVCRYWHQRGVLRADMETASPARRGAPAQRCGWPPCSATWWPSSRTCKRG